MNISVFGLGYVGCITAACLAQDGHRVIGVDVNEHKIKTLVSGQSPISEPGLNELIYSAITAGSLRVTQDSKEALDQSNISLVCVGTPCKGNGQINLEAVEKVCHEIGRTLNYKNDFHVVVIRSTVLPGTLQEKLIPLLEQVSRKRAGSDFGICMNPEFLREGSALVDYYNPGFIIIGEIDTLSGKAVERIYKSVDAPVIHTSISTAEIIKYTCNAFHALKVVFANEIGVICKKHGIDGQSVMDIVCMDKRLNVSPAYLRPGFAFGGSCLPKDMRALTYRAKERDISVPVLDAIIQSNENHIQRAIKLVEATGCNKVGILGLSFKPHTDDVRESPAIVLVETLIGRGYKIAVYDAHVDPDKLIGANRAFLERELPHIASLMRPSIEEVMQGSEVIVITQSSPEFRQVPKLLQARQTLIDLTGISKDSVNSRGCYEGICW